MDSGFSKIRQWIYREKFTFLLLSLFVYILAAPFIEPFMERGYFARISFLIVLFAGVFSVSEEKKDLILVSSISVFSILILCIKIFTKNDRFLMLDIFLKFTFNACLIYIMVGHFYKCERVSRNTISAALIGYLLITLLWSNLYIFIELTYPGSFSIPHETLMEDISVFRYFSFVTITTLGFGDIAPVAPQARNITVLEAYTGQMYMAVLIARLVAIHTSQAHERDSCS